MRLLVDAQCVQSSSSMRGIGRYALCLTRALSETAGQHSVEVLLNGGDDPGRLMRARQALEGFLDASQVHVFDAAWPWTPPYDDRRRRAAEAAYAAAVRSLRPDVLLVASPFEGDGENVLSVRPTASDPPTAAVLYDLIPALDPGTYLMGPGADVYWRRFEQLERCSALLAISEHSGRQAEQLLGDAVPAVTPIWGGAYPSGDFPAFEPDVDDHPDLQLPEHFVLCVGGDHPRKNLDRLVAAWALVPDAVRRRTPLVVACRLNSGTVRRLSRLARTSGVLEGELVLIGGVSEARLQDLYARASAFVFPSLEEGLGMPPLEAMAADCPTLLARGSSLSELCDEPTAYFDGSDVPAMAQAMERVLREPHARDMLRSAGAETTRRFTWHRTARLAWAALERCADESTHQHEAPSIEVRPLSGFARARECGDRPTAVLVDRPLPAGPVGELGLPVEPRALLAGVAALLVAEPSGTREALQAGLLEQAVLTSRASLATVAAHDFLGQYRIGLASLQVPEELATDIVAAVSYPPRWTLERPRPVWLLLNEESVVDAVVERGESLGLDIVSARPQAAALGLVVDAVFVSPTDLAAHASALAAARRRGAAVVTVLSTDLGAPVPDWSDRLVLEGPWHAHASWEPHLAGGAERWSRTSGWPWRTRG